ncbi:MAG: hypothetical protein AB1941_09985 [Gemmatimonadota bacterium]
MQQLAEEGIVKKVRHGRYDLAGSVQGYLQYVRESASRASSSGDEAAALKLDILRMEHEERRLELARKRGDMVSLGFHLDKLEQVLMPVATGLNNLPGILADRVAASDDPADCLAMMEGEVEKLKRVIHEAFPEPDEEDLEAGAEETSEEGGDAC